MYTLATNIRNWVMKVVRVLNHRGNLTKTNKTKGGPPEGKQNHRENQNKIKTPKISCRPRFAPNVLPPGSA